MRSLTVTEARTRVASIRATYYEIDLDLTRGDRHFGSRTVIEFSSLDRQSTWVDLQPAELLAVHLNGRALDPADLWEGRLHLDSQILRDDNTLVVDALMAYSHDGEALHRSVDPEDKQTYVYAFTFLSAAPRVFACFDQPDLKAVVRMSVTAPDDWLVLGNGRATQVAPGRWQLAETQPLATYFITLAAGPYHHVTREHDGILLGLACRQSLAEHLDKDADEVFDVTTQCFDAYHDMFGVRYPFGDYHQVFVPEFNAGAMENPGCVVFTDTLIFRAQATDTLRASRACVIAHEMAHQWFGDLVTMAWWDDLWLNESFAEYMAYSVTATATAFDDVWSEFAYARKAWGMAADQRPTTHPVAGNGARNTDAALADFDGISYSKGCAALRQLRSYLGEPFVAGVVDHLTTHAYGNARLGDLLASWDSFSDRDVKGWADAWLTTAGVDSLAVSVGGDRRPVLRRTDGSNVPTSRPHAIHVTWFKDDGTSETIPVTVADDETPLSFEGFDGSGFVLPDSRDETWAKVLLDDASLANAASTLRRVDEPLAQAVIWAALREGLFDGLVDPEHYLQVVEEALDSQIDLSVEAILATATTAVGRYFGDASRRDRLAALAARLLTSSDPASNRQLVTARAYLSLTRDVSVLRDWEAGHTPDGLVVDDDLRWRILRARCDNGDGTRDEIDAGRQRDPSSQGALRALECRACLPADDSKAEVWSLIATDRDLNNYELYSLGAYFFRPGQDAVTRQFVAQFFTDLPATVEFRSGWMLEQLVSLSYPATVVSSETLDLARECLDGGGLTDGVRRSIADRTDDLRRAFESRQLFAR